MPLQLLKPDAMNERRLRVVGLGALQRHLAHLLLALGLGLSRLEGLLLLGGLADQAGHVDGLLGHGVQRDHGEGAVEQHVFGLGGLAGGAGARDAAGYFERGAARGVGHLAAVFEVGDFGEGVGDGDAVEGGGYDGDAFAGRC